MIARRVLGRRRYSRSSGRCLGRGCDELDERKLADVDDQSEEGRGSLTVLHRLEEPVFECGQKL